MLVAIPSKGRAGRVKSQTLITSAHVFVPALEADAYLRTGSKNVVPVPDDIRGITKTRNWILDYAIDVLGEPRVVFIDDDLKIAGWIKLFAHHSRHQKLEEGEWLAEWTRLFDVMDGMGLSIWGTATDGAPRSVYPYKPFLFRTYVTASCMGMRSDTSLRFDESFPVKEDYELTLRCIKNDGAILGARYLYWVNSHWGDNGGCRDYRTQRMEEDAILRLMQLYPGMIRKVTRGGSSFSIELDF